jgi:hypothetical protein
MYKINYELCMLRIYRNKNQAQKKAGFDIRSPLFNYLTLYYNLDDSTRRFWIRPSSVSLEAIGFASP